MKTNSKRRLASKTTSRRRRRSPERTCAVCRARRGKDELIRVAKPDDAVVVDPTGKGAGRGVYICRRATCLLAPDLAGRVAQGLRSKLTEHDRQRLEEWIESLVEAQPDTKEHQ